MWDLVDDVYPGDDIPWMAIRELNDTCSLVECLSLEESVQWEESALLHFMNRWGLFDLGFNGPPFTWSNNHHGSTRIWRRLDRGIANSTWRTTFQDASIFHEIAVGSDHRPLVLSMSKRGRFYRRAFKYEIKWQGMEGYLEAITTGWGLDHRGSSLYKFSRNLRGVRSSLLQWITRVKTNCRRHIEAVIDQLDMLHNLPIAEQDRHREKLLLK